MGKHRIKPIYRRRVLRLPDLDHCKWGVPNSLGSPASRRVYEYAIDQFIAWYCSEPRLAFNRIVVVRYRMYLEGRRLAANTINQQLAAVRRLAHEAADAGLLSPDLAAGPSEMRSEIFMVVGGKKEKPDPLKCRFHDLRHSAVTRLLEAGIPYPVVASMMGWSAA